MGKDKIIRSYSLAEKIRLVYFLIRTKLIYRRARLIRFPIVIRGRKFISFGEGLTTGFWCRFEVNRLEDDNRKRIIFGDNIQVNDFVHISAMERVEIGDGCLMASHIYISDNSHGCYKGYENDSDPSVQPDHRDYLVNPVIIGKNVWIGEGVIIMPGVKIGDGCVIGAHSLVNKSIPPRTIVGGNPATPIKRYSEESKKWIRI